MMSQRQRGFLALLACTVLFWSPSSASVGVFPQVLFINAPNRSVAITVSNPTELRQEVWVGFRYGYPMVNDSGKFYMVYMDSTSLTEPNAVPWLTAYPQRFVLEGRESQVVRVMAQLPVGQPSGEYWARVVVSSMNRSASPAVTPGGSLSMRMQFISEVNVPLQVRNGAVSSGVRIRGISSLVDSGKLKMGVDMARLGNASFWGTMHLYLRDQDGRVMATENQHIAIFRDMVYPITMEVADLPSGPYVLEIDVDNIRQGIPPRFRVKADPVRFTYQLTIP